MRVEYDLVVIGDGLSGRWAALSAARQYARVALIPAHQQVDFALTAMQTLLAQMTASATLGHPHPFDTISALRRWFNSNREKLRDSYSRQRLAHHGVDVLEHPGHFVSPTQRVLCPAIESAGRLLRSRAYLLTLDQAIAFEDFPSQEIQSLEDCLAKLESLGSEAKIFIHSRYPWAIGLGQLLNQMGYTITLVDDQPLLTREDPDVAFWMQCLLEAQGIKLQIGETSSTQADVLLKPAGKLSLESLKLQHLGMDQIHTSDPFAPQLLVNSQLQSQHSQLYACGSVLGGYSLPQITQQEVSVALENLLFQTHRSLQYEHWAYSLPLLPGFSRIGLTEPQARQRFSQIKVMTSSRNASVFNSDNILFCKVIAKSTGEILGMHCCGHEAHHASRIFESIMREGRQVPALGQCTWGSIQLQDVFQDFAYRWVKIQTPRKRDRLEQYFREKRKQFS